MGDEADARLDWEIGRALMDWPRASPRVRYHLDDGFQQTEWWTMKTGERIRLVDMTPRHRGNTVRMLEREVAGVLGVTVRELHEAPLIRKMIELGIE